MCETKAQSSGSEKCSHWWYECLAGITHKGVLWVVTRVINSIPVEYTKASLNVELVADGNTAKLFLKKTLYVGGKEN